MQLTGFDGISILHRFSIALFFNNIIAHSQICYTTNSNLANIFYTTSLRLKTNKDEHRAE